MFRVLFFLLLFSSIHAQEILNEPADIFNLEEKGITTEKYHTYSLDAKLIQKYLRKAPSRKDKNQLWLPIQIPFPDGKIHTILAAEAKITGDKIYNKYPKNRAYKIKGTQNDGFLTGMLMVTVKGINAYIKTSSQDIFIEPIGNDQYISYTPDASMKGNKSCGTTDEFLGQKKKGSTRDSYGGTLREYTMAIASSGEWSNERDDDLAVINADILIYLGELNALYESELSISFVLADDNDDIIFFDPDTDGLNPANGFTKVTTAHSVIATHLSSTEYDIGHVFYEIPYSGSGATGSGIAGLGVTCSNSFKGRGWSGCGGNYSTAFWMDIFAHEVGHQFGAYHSFYGTSGNCINRSEGHGAEPGSGNSLMSYEGICFQTSPCTNSHNITPEASSLYFHALNIEEIQDYAAGSGNCSSDSTSGNSSPVITMPSNYTIPAETPFSLEASATDADGDNLTFSWEEMDLDELDLSCPNGDPDQAATSSTAPLFRSFDPSENGNLRHFPQLNDILSNSQTKGEILPEVDRSIIMRMTVRDDNPNGGATSEEEITLTVEENAGPFEVTTTNNATTYSAGQTLTVQWNVNNTNVAPISCSNVNILFSTDGGSTFPITLASSVTNDGNQSVTLPNVGTTIGRIKVEAVGNIFFDINNADITLLSDCNPIVTSIINSDPISAEPGDPSLDLDLTIGEIITAFSGNFDASSPSMNLVLKNSSSGNCTIFGNTPKYNNTEIKTTETGDYIFTSSAPFFEIMNFYDGTFTAGSPCSNWEDSNGNWNPTTGIISPTNPFTVNIAEGETKEFVLSAFSSSNTGAWSVTYTGPGDLYKEILAPGGYTITYVISDSNEDVVDIMTDPDLSDDAIYTSGYYTVEPLMYETVENLVPYIGGGLNTLKSDIALGNVCGLFGSNSIVVTIEGCTPETKTVTSGLDDGNPNTLRSIIQDACPEDLIVFSPSLANATITLNSPIIINQEVNIEGLGGNFSLSGGNTNRIFSIESTNTLSLDNMTLKNGYNGGNTGGAFLNNGIVNLDNVIFEGNISGLVDKAFTNYNAIHVEVGGVDVKD